MMSIRCTTLFEYKRHFVWVYMWSISKPRITFWKLFVLFSSSALSLTLLLQLFHSSLLRCLLLNDLPAVSLCKMPEATAEEIFFWHVNAKSADKSAVDVAMLECPFNCLTCTDKGDGVPTMKCKTCSYQYVLNEDDCGACPRYCLKCSESKNGLTCTQCQNKTVMMSDGTCER